MATQGRRYRSTEGWWTIPYVDDEQMVFVRDAQTGDGSLTLLLGCAFQVVAMAAQGLHSTFIVLVGMMGAAGGAMALVLAGDAPVRGAYYSRLHIPRAPFIVRRVPGSPLRFEAGLNGRVIGPTSKRGLLHATLAGQERLLLVLGDEVIELWRSQDLQGGGNPVVAHHWTLEHLSAGEGSAAVGEPEEGDGRVVPIVEGLRRVLAIDGAGETNLQGPKPWPWYTLVRFAVLLGVPALYGLLVWRVALWARSTESVESSLAFAAFVGVSFVLFEVLVLRMHYRWFARRLIDDVVEGIVSNGMFWVR
jgi:hypothetical protein